jgi:adenylate kinase
LGAPGAGKGTIAEGIAAGSRFAHVSTGDMLREAVKKGAAVGREAEAYMKRGELVPDETILRIVEARVDAGGADAAYMFDGFPRTLKQAELLDRMLERHQGRVNHVFLLDAPRDLLITRLTGRRVCRKCGAGYHVVNIPPRKAGVCDACGGELYQRPDDQEATILNRLDVYERQTKELIEYYDRQNLLVRIDSARHREVTVAEILDHLRRLSDS